MKSGGVEWKENPNLKWKNCISTKRNNRIKIKWKASKDRKRNEKYEEDVNQRDKTRSIHIYDTLISTYKTLSEKPSAQIE